MSIVETVTPTEVAVSSGTLRVIETKPAVVSFNYDEISLHLDSVLVKYQGLIFTESTASECKRTIAELRKGQKALDEFRLSTKKQLTESVTDFEKQCKKLFIKFDTVILPLTTQQDQFELDRREKKRVDIQSVIDVLISEHGLWEKYGLKLVIPEEYFNKGKTIKAIKTELSTFATSLKVQQDKEAQDEDLIKTKVELANAQYQLFENALFPEPYLRLLSHHSVANIEVMITSDAEQIVEREKKAAEARIAKQAEMVKVEEVVQPEPAKVPVYTPTPVFTAEPSYSPAPIFTAEPLRIKTVMTAVYEITGTEEQLSDLEAYLDAKQFQLD